jgi:hypothetical protein
MIVLIWFYKYEGRCFCVCVTAILWKDIHNVNILTNMHPPPAEGNFCNEHAERGLWNWQQYDTVTNIWGMLTRVTTWQTVTPLADGHGNGWKNSCFTFCTWHFWTPLLSSFLLVQNWHTEISDLLLSKTLYKTEERCLRLLYGGDKLLQQTNLHDLKTDTTGNGPRRENVYVVVFSRWNKEMRVMFKCEKCIK